MEIFSLRHFRRDEQPQYWPVFCRYNPSALTIYSFHPTCPLSPLPCDPAAGSTRTAGACELGSPESSLSPRSDLSVPSNPARSAQSLSSYNPFEDEEDTGSTVSEKEDVKAKKLVNKRFPWFPPRSLCLSPSLCPGSRHSQQCMRPAGGGPAVSCGQSLASRFLGEGAPVNKLCLLFLCPPLTHVKAPPRKIGLLGSPASPLERWFGPAGSLTAALCSCGRSPQPSLCSGTRVDPLLQREQLREDARLPHRLVRR